VKNPRDVRARLQEIASDEVIRRFDLAVAQLLRRDAYLFLHDVNERTITHKLAEYMQPLFPGWNVDCEYNRNMHTPKRVHLPTPGDPEARCYVSTYPDIIVHHRGTNARNLLIVEAKKDLDNRLDGEARDRMKLEAYARELGYRLGIFAVFLAEGQKAACVRTTQAGGEWSAPVRLCG
jgi:hypothetical protein